MYPCRHILLHLACCFLYRAHLQLHLNAVARGEKSADSLTGRTRLICLRYLMRHTSRGSWCCSRDIFSAIWSFPAVDATDLKSKRSVVRQLRSGDELLAHIQYRD
ncbi:hypothetical protein B0H19DRAFT_579860 [Mycena capillaripes]|nr:hypothetical protein B0H19DRAFT_579860 [Mycena capillaripes]